MAALDDIKQAVLDMVSEKVEKLVQRALNEGTQPAQIINEALIPAVDIVGEEYESGE